MTGNQWSTPINSAKIPGNIDHNNGQMIKKKVPGKTVNIVKATVNTCKFSLEILNFTFIPNGMFGSKIIKRYSMISGMERGILLNSG